MSRFIVALACTLITALFFVLLATTLSERDLQAFLWMVPVMMFFAYFWERLRPDR